MKLYVIASPDGDLYVEATRRANRTKAADLGAKVVMANANGLYDEATVAAVTQAVTNGLWDKLYNLLVDAGTIRERYTVD